MAKAREYMSQRVAGGILREAIRHELHDRTFGDSEIHWMVGETVVAEGYIGRNGVHLSMMETVDYHPTAFEGPWITKHFLEQGIENHVEYNS